MIGRSRSHFYYIINLLNLLSADYFIQLAIIVLAAKHN